MAYEKLYTVIGFENRPSRKALLSAENLNKMDSAINALDGRIVEMSGKADTDASDIALNRQTLGYVKKNLFNINGEVNTDYNGGISQKNTVRDGVLTTNTNRDITSGAGQMIATEIGKTYIVSATIVSLGTGNKATIIVTKKGTNHIKVLDTDEVGKRIFISYTAESTDTLIEFATRGGTGAKFTDIQFEEVADRVTTPTDYEPYVDDVDTRLKKVETKVMPIERGGTGATTAKEAQYNLLKDMNSVTNNFVDTSLITSVYTEPTENTGMICKRTALSLWNYIKSKIEGITVTNLLATVAGKPLDATMGKALNDKIETLGGFTPVIDETTGKITGYTTTIGGADTVFPFKSVVHCGSYTENGSFDVTTFGLSNVKRKNFIFVPTLAQTWVYGTATKIPYTNYEYARGFGGYKPHTFALSGNILTFTLPICTGSAYCGPTASNASVEVGEAYTLAIAGDIYYIG